HLLCRVSGRGAARETAEDRASGKPRAPRVVEIEQPTYHFARGVEAGNRNPFAAENLTLPIDPQAAEGECDAAGDRVGLEWRGIDRVGPVAFGRLYTFRAAAVLDRRVELYVLANCGVV